MHIADGILSAPVLTAGTLAGAAGIAYGVRRMDMEKVPQVAVLASGFFVASLIHIPVPPTSVHLLLPGLLGVVLGWSVFPAVFVGLLMQFMFFGHGGLTTIGVNTLNMALPGLCCYYLFGRMVNHNSKRLRSAAAFASGSLGVVLACILYAGTLYVSNQAFTTIAAASLTCHLPVAIIEGLVTLAAIGFLQQARPEVLTAGIPTTDALPE